MKLYDDYACNLAAEDYRLEKCAVPEVGEGELLVKILAVGICAGDAKCFAGVPYFWGKVYPLIWTPEMRHDQVIFVER